MYSTVQDIANAVILDLRQVPGVDVQTYSQDHIKLRIKRRFTMLFREAWWPDLTHWAQRELDGTLGVLTAPIEGVSSIRDVQCFSPAQPRYQLALLPVSENPFELSGSSPRYYSQHEDRANHTLQFWPKTATGTVTIQYRAFPTTFFDDDILYIEDNILAAFVAYDIAAGDGANPNDVDRMRIEAEALLGQRRRDFTNMPRQKDPRIGVYPMDWQELR